jgi:dTDP-4-amino-4,6-dideoxygalactose transaminase
VFSPKNPMNATFSRRNFITSVTAAAAGARLVQQPVLSDTSLSAKPALLGGSKSMRGAFPPWPIHDTREEEALLKTLRSGKWFRGDGHEVTRFEQAFARLTGAKHCIATNGGTTALISTLGALDVGPGDEVIVTPYTFIATMTSILLHYALPVFVDVDPNTFQIDATKIESAITDRTVALLPVHIGGNPADLDRVLEVGRKHRLPVIEDCCQAHVARWRDRHVGTWGKAGCFSFQVSKNLCSGEGGAVLTDDDELAERVYAFHNNCRVRNTGNYNFFYMPTRAGNFRMTEFQGSLLQAQMTRLEEQSRVREKNAAYLTNLLSEIPGIRPCRTHEGCTRHNYHLYMFRYTADAFSGLSRERFLAALRAEGIPCSGGYSPVAWSAFLKESLASKAARRVFPSDSLKHWEERCQIPEHERLCREGVWFFQPVLLGQPGDMDRIAEAIRKIQAHAGDLLKA